MCPGIVIGSIGGAIVMAVSKLMKRFRIDDVVDAVAVHLGCGIWSAISAPFFAKTVINDKTKKTFVTMKIEKVFCLPKVFSLFAQITFRPLSCLIITTTEVFTVPTFSQNILRNFHGMQRWVEVPGK